LGDTGSYVLGRTAGAAAARRLFRSPKAKGRLTWAGEALDRHGATIIVVARFVPGGRTATTFTAGTVRQPWPSFAAADAVGATLWAAYAAGLSYVGGETFERRSLYGFCSVWASPCWAPLSWSGTAAPECPRARGPGRSWPPGGAGRTGGGRVTPRTPVG
jgi:membrane-associated protein